MRVVFLAGGDAARQRAEEYARKYGGEVVRVTDIPFAMLYEAGLDEWYRDKDGIEYQYAVIKR